MQIGEEIYATLWSDVSIIKVKIRANFEKNLSGVIRANRCSYLLTNLHYQAEFWRRAFFHLSLSEYANITNPIISQI